MLKECTHVVQRMLLGMTALYTIYVSQFHVVEGVHSARHIYSVYVQLY